MSHTNRITRVGALAVACLGGAPFLDAQSGTTSASPPRPARALRNQNLAGARATSLQRVRYLGFDAYRLSDGRSEAVIVPVLGRVMRYGLVNGPNLLWNAVPGPTPPGEWRNWGGDKSWPGPQSRWPLSIGRQWPPAPEWDGHAYIATVLPYTTTRGSLKRLRITSGIWPRWGCRVIREFGFDPNGDFVITQTFEKLGGPPVELAIWDIAQVATPQAIFVLTNPQSPYTNQFYWLTKPDPKAVAPDIVRVEPNLLRVRPRGAGQSKMGIDAPLACLIVVNQGLAFRQSARRPPGSYPDGAEGSGFPLEIFDIGGTGSSHYMETELLSPLRLFYKGSRWSHTVTWSLHRLQNKPIDSPELTAEMQQLLIGNNSSQEKH